MNLRSVLHSVLRIRLFVITALVALLSFLAVPRANAQYTIQYTKFGDSPTGLGGDAVYSSTAHNIDSVWTVLQATGKIAGVEIYKAHRFADGSHVGDYEVSKNIREVYKTAHNIAGASVDTGKVTVPTSNGTPSSITRYIPTLDSVVNTTTETAFLTQTIDSGEWEDGQVLEITVLADFNFGAAADSIHINFVWGSDTVCVNPTYNSLNVNVGGNVAIRILRLIREGSSIYVEGSNQLGGGTDAANIGYDGTLLWAPPYVMRSVSFTSSTVAALTVHYFGAADANSYIKPIAARILKY